jgi:hypothetical protein
MRGKVHINNAVNGRDITGKAKTDKVMDFCKID